jgi:hypothetical protein
MGLDRVEKCTAWSDTKSGCCGFGGESAGAFGEDRVVSGVLIAPTGRNVIAQGNALGLCDLEIIALKGRNMI